jgi:hypothetical protein
VGRTQIILGILGLSVVSAHAHAGEAGEAWEVGETGAIPTEAEVPAAEPPVGAEPADAASAPATAPREPRGARVVWAKPGESVPMSPSVPPEPPARRKRGFRVRNVGWVVGLDRASSIAGYRATAGVSGASDVITRGVEASIIGDVSQDAYTPLVLPRLSVDRRWANGFSLGGVVSYAARSARESSDGSSQALPSSESALVGPRVGWLKPLSGNVAVWLRGGPTWAMRATSDLTSEPGELRTFTERQWAISLEPQLVIMPLPHVGFSLGAAFDLGFDGETKLTYRGGPQPEISRVHQTVSTYGLTAGLLALF